MISGTNWQDEKIETIFRGMVNDDIGDESGVLIFDESGFIKKGEDSAGVSRQYCRSIGKVENSQVGVFAAYAAILWLITNYIYLKNGLLMSIWKNEISAGFLLILVLKQSLNSQLKCSGRFSLKKYSHFDTLQLIQSMEKIKISFGQ